MRNSFWAQLYFEDFIRHFRKLDDAAIVADVKQSMDDLENRDPEGSSFGAEMVASTLGRIRGNRDKYGKYGALGGRPRKQISPPVPVSASGDAAVGGLLTPWIGPGTGESFDQGPDNGHRLPATTRADAHAREDWDASTTVRAQDFDGDAATREGAEAAASGFATSPSDIQRRPGKSATTSYERPIRNGGSERGAGGTAIDAVRRSPGAMKAERKLRYGGAGNVLMTATEMAKLAAEFGDVRQITEELSDYLLLHPGKYRSHYAALRNWCRRRVREGRNPDGTKMTQGDRLARHFAEREREILDGNVERE